MLATIGERNQGFDNYKYVRHFQKGEMIPLTHNSIWLIEKGAVKTLTWDEAGKILILGYWGKKDIIGLPLSTVNPYEARCLDKVDAINIPWGRCSFLFKEISYCLRQTDDLLRIVRIDKMYKRLLHLLMWLANKFGSKTLQGIIINIRLTHQELADIVGATRVTVTRLLNKLEKEEIIIRPRRFYIIIKDINLLSRV